MKRVLYLICVAALLAGGGTVAAVAADGYWQQFVHYTINVELDPDTHMLTGKQTILYRNNSPDTLTKFYMHLYPNGYRDPNTLRAREARRFYRRLNTDPEAAGWIDIKTFHIIPKGKPEEARLTAYRIEDTLLEADLPEPLPPGGEMTIELTFDEKVRRHSGRAGYRGTQYDFAQWYPKPAVYDENGWNNVPFHLTGEFYGEFGTFDVTVTVPFEYIVGATGVVVSGDPGWEWVKVDTSLSEEEFQSWRNTMQDSIKAAAEKTPQRTVTFHAEQVHDFAWVACPDFLYERGEWDGIPIHVLYRSWAKKRWSKIVAERGALALEWLSTKVGRYPYPQLTITHGLLGGGMEYPMLVMNASESEGLILHEVGHIYFYGIFGNNEQKEAWLDEGFTSFQTRWYMETRYGKWGYDRQEELKDANWLQRRRPESTSRDNTVGFALFYMQSGKNEPISKWAYQFDDPMGYGVNAYTKGSLFFDMLRYVVGEETFEEILHEYFRRWALKHVTEERFRQVAEDVSGMDLKWFFDEWLHGTPTVDYALGRVRKTQTDGAWRTEVEVVRRADGIMPVEVLLKTDADEKVVKRWEGFAEKGTVTVETRGKPVQVTLDPNDQILDANRLNNGPFRIEFLFDYPNMNYSPRDAYLLTWRPSGWYNEVDGAKPGVRLGGRYQNDYNLSAGLWFGSESREVDGLLRFSKRINTLWNRWSVSAQKMEGRFLADANLQWRFGRYLFTPPNHTVTVGVAHDQLLEGDEEYAVAWLDAPGDPNVPTWSRGEVNRAYLTYSVNPRGMQWFSDIRLQAETAQDFWGSDFTFTKLSGEVKFWVTPKLAEFRLRGFAGVSLGDDAPPLQDLYYAFGASPREQFGRYYLRSKGGLPRPVHVHMPGGGNLRGYYNQALSGDRLYAANLEIRKSARLPLLSKLLGRTSVVLFGDVGRLEMTKGYAIPESTEQTLADAGIGLRFQRFLPDQWYTFFTGGRNITLRVDFPFYVNEPRPGDSEVEFRWVVGFEQVL